MTYYRSRIDAIESIRATLKHSNPEDVDLNDIRGTLGYIIPDLEVLNNLRRPHSYKMTEEEDGGVTVEIIMKLNADEAEDMVRKLWLQSDQ